MPIAPILGFLGGNWKILAIIGAVLVIIFCVWRWEQNIKDAAFETFFADQVRQQLEQKDQEITKLKGLQDLDRRKLEEARTRENQIRRSLHNLLDSVKNLPDNPSSETLKQGLRNLEINGGISK